MRPFLFRHYNQDIMGRYPPHTTNRFSDPNPGVCTTETTLHPLRNSPKIDHSPNDSYFECVIQITGFEPEKIVLQVLKPYLVVKALKEEVLSNEDNGYLRNNIRETTIEHRFELGELADPDNITVRFEGEQMILRLYHR